MSDRIFFERFGGERSIVADLGGIIVKICIPSRNAAGRRLINPRIRQ